MRQFGEIFASTFKQVLFLVVPISLLTFLLRAQIVRLVYGAGDKFTWDDTRLTAAALGIFAFGILFQALIPFLARTFFAVQNTRIPTFISVGSVMINIFFAVFFMSVLATSNSLTSLLVAGLKLQGIGDIRVLALPLALVVSGIVQAMLLLLFLRRYIREGMQKDLYISAIKTTGASFALAFVTYTILQLYGGAFALRTYHEVLGQFILASLGGSIAYILAAFLLRSQEMIYFWNVFRSKIYGR